MKDNHFDTVVEPRLVDAWAKYMRSQVEIFIGPEVELLCQHGLRENGPILDAGCGAGDWSRACRDLIGGVSFVGADSNTALLEIYRELLRSEPDPYLTIVQWKIGEEPAPPEARKCRSAVVRYVLQHLVDPRAFLGALREILPVGALIWIIEEEDALFAMDPPQPILDQMFEIHSAWATQFNSVADMGRRCPSIAKDAGLAVECVRIIGQTSLETGMDAFVDYYLHSLTLIAESARSVMPVDVEKQVRKVLDSLRGSSMDDFVIFQPQVVTVARVI